MRNFCLKVHRFLALPLGIFISILCFTGLLLVFRDDIASLLGTNAKEMPFFIAMKKLHRWLFMMPENPHGGLSVGRVIMAISSMAMMIVLLTGVVNWCPKTKKALKNRLKVSTNKGFRRFVYDTHVSLGIYAFIFLFLMALTGPVFSFGWYRQGMSKLFGQKIEKKEVKKEAKSDDTKNVPTKDDAFAHANPEQVKVHPQTLENEKQGQKHDEKGKKPKKGKLFKALHTGTWGGMFSKILYALAALIGGFLPISGYYMWWKRTSSKKKKAKA